MKIRGNECPRSGWWKKRQDSDANFATKLVKYFTKNEESFKKKELYSVGTGSNIPQSLNLVLSVVPGPKS